MVLPGSNKMVFVAETLPPALMVVSAAPGALIRAPPRPAPLP